MSEPLIARRFAVVAALLATTTALALPDAVAPPASVSLLSELSFERTSLPNGMRVVTSVDRSASTLAACLVLPVGSRDEPPGALGMATLEQQVALEGVRGDDVSDQVRQHRGQESSAVGVEATSYCVDLPSGELELAIRLLAARLNAPPPTPDSFTRLSLRVQEQASHALADDASRAGAVRLQKLAYEGCAPYENEPVASAQAIDSAAAARARDFYVQHHVPRGAAVVVVGNFDPDAAVYLARARFGSTSPQSTGPRDTSESAPALPHRTSERYSSLERPEVQTAELLFGWVAPLHDMRERAAFDLAAAVLALGQGSRLDRLLVDKRPWASEVQARTERLYGPELLLLRVLAKNRADPVEISKLVEAELFRFANAGPSAEELRRARAELTDDWRRRLSSNVARARQLGQFEAVWGTAEALKQRIAAYASITPTEVRDVVRAYLRPWQKTHVAVQPKTALTQVTAAPPKRYHVVRPNENLTRIAKLYGVGVSELSAMNETGRDGAIHPGQKLELPRSARVPKPPRSHTIKKGDSLLGIAKHFGVSVADIVQANGLRRNKPIQPGQKLAIPPSSAPAAR
ncbi:MAG: LysM peptidoglycan-binding domain-containing protein [Polyangiaceae bacterium]|nr:LysM peptidoglycan-binding domain-containing protein [Polyangiaceae bacterium]